MTNGVISEEACIQNERSMEAEWQEATATPDASFKKEIEMIMAGEKGLSFSALKAFLQSPRHFFKYKTQKGSTAAMEEGTLFHLAVLEPEVFKTKYFVLEDTNVCIEIGGARPRTTSRYKDWLEQEIARHPGQEMISQEEWDQYTGMAKFLRENSATKHLLEGLIATEKPFKMTYEGYLVTGRIDGVGSDYVMDLKKVADASFKKVKWIIYDMMYDMQGAIYSLAEGKNKFYLVFIDNAWNVTVVKICVETLQAGLSKFEGALSEFTRCVEEDLFQSSYEFYNHGFIEI